MAATSLSKTMLKLLARLQADYTDIDFKKGDSFYWSPKNRTVTYALVSTLPDVSLWSLLHEVSHGILGHTQYKSDFELMQLEVAAWQHAQKLAKKYDIRINPDHIQDCLDTYRDWLHRRSTCPTCGTVSAQTDPKSYRCLNCKTIWHVSNSRFCRPYRRLATVK